MNCFQLKIFQEINKSTIGQNIMVSPLSIYHILSLTANGAANNTLQEMLKALSEKDPEVCMKEISEEFPEVEGFFGQVEHSFSGQTFGLVMGTTYGHDPLDDYK